MVLAGSNHHTGLRASYCSVDIDTYCEGDPSRTGWKELAGGSFLEGPNEVNNSSQATGCHSLLVTQKELMQGGGYS